eukprot:TRINITY_DN566_c1_g1_i1.p1 TRINITY_DN566_c1_g1~~TRINITY_DN566_c1_g1_i1.p1  ORF type:complete len:440 (+),score=93.00 TRINITY_DN566_c1_g1_i1:83-1402(+)
MVAAHSTAGRKEKKHAGTNNATAEDQCHPKKIFVGGLAHKCTTQHLREHFLRFGPILDAVVLRWPDGRSRGFGYVTFADLASASSALKEAHSVGGRQVEVKRAVPGTNKLFVGGLPQNTPASELREHFERFGVVSDAVVMIDAATNRSRGFGFVCFLPGQEGAEAVAAALSNYENHYIRNKWIEVKSASPPHKLVGKDRPHQADNASTTATDDSSSDGDEKSPHERHGSHGVGTGSRVAGAKTSTARSSNHSPPGGSPSLTALGEPMMAAEGLQASVFDMSGLGGDPQKIPLSRQSAASQWLNAGSAAMPQQQQQQFQQTMPYPFGPGFFSPEAHAHAAHWFYAAMAASAAAAAAATAHQSHDMAFGGAYPPPAAAAPSSQRISLPPGLGSESHGSAAAAQDISLNIDGLLRQTAAMQQAGEAGRSATVPAQGRTQVQI